MKQIINAKYENGRMVLTSNNEAINKIINKLQFIYDKNLFNQNLNLWSEQNMKFNMFNVIFEFNNELTFIEHVENIYAEYQYEIKKREKLQNIMASLNEEKSRITSLYSNELSDLTMKILEEVETEMNSECPSIVLPALNKRFFEERKSIDKKWKKEIDKFEIHAEEIIFYHTYNI